MGREVCVRVQVLAAQPFLLSSEPFPGLVCALFQGMEGRKGQSGWLGLQQKCVESKRSVIHLL